jgi:hypothetical protein
MMTPSAYLAATTVVPWGTSCDGALDGSAIGGGRCPSRARRAEKLGPGSSVGWKYGRVIAERA